MAAASASAAKPRGAGASGKSVGLELHFAVWDNDLGALAKLLEADTHDLETQDRTGASAYVLALKLGHTRAAHMLIRAGACPRAKTALGWEPIQLAALTANSDLTRIAVVSMLKDMDLAWERRLPKHLDRLRAMPDFVMTMNWDFSSWVPLVSTILPRDTVTVYKRGTAVRVDTTLLGFSGMSWGRGSISFIVQGEEQGNPGAWFVMDNELKTAANARAALTNPPDHTIEDWVRKLLGNQQKRTKWNGAALRLETEKRSTWMGLGAAEEVVEAVGSFKGCSAYSMTGLSMVEWKHPPVLKKPPAKADWWLPGYSTAARRLPRRDRHPGIVTEEGAGGDWPEDDGVSGPTASGEEAAKVASGVYGTSKPEVGIEALKAALESIRTGDVSEGHDIDVEAAAAAAAAEAAADGGDAEAAAAGVGASAATVKEGIRDSAVDAGWARSLDFGEYFRGDTTGTVPEDAEENHKRGDPGSVRVDLMHAGVHVSAGPGTDPRAAGAGHPSRIVADTYPDNLQRSAKDFEGRVLLAPDFPITPKEMLPLAEVMSLSSKHFKSMKRFFESRIPEGKGFPVQFSLPVFPTVTATVKVVSMVLDAPEAELFRVPDDYAMGKYVERTAVRQLG
ncbi:hypothetical protein FNF27_01659 [Cafeteria roenbergensis]|uniref:Ankyrin repeat domain-containing protein n=1 Tax=Cafeteria roenbergensis TaxID=33653 RepID=A0A5A8EJL9_CAFRO|nr:hypothetical protein FNF27_01659 [Cafeteria roenbergensis]